VLTARAPHGLVVVDDKNGAATEQRENHDSGSATSWRVPAATEQIATTDHPHEPPLASGPLNYWDTANAVPSHLSDDRIDHIDWQLDQFPRQPGQAIGAAPSVPAFDDQVLAFDVPQVTQGRGNLK
jgi:hypothetical protein